jgi:predicted peptidase
VQDSISLRRLHSLVNFLAMKNHRNAVGLLLAIFLISSAPSVFGRKHETGFLDRSVTVNGVAYRYQVYVPQNFDSQKKWPVILFLHGVGERGDDGLQPTDVGIGHAIRMNASRFPFIVVMPQCRNDKRWIHPEMQALALAALDQAIKEFHGDRQRLYLTGLSMGGYGTWNMTAMHPGEFAAYVPICGGIFGPPKTPDARVAVAADPNVPDPYAETAKRIGSTPIWIFHGGADDTVPVEESRKMAQALQTAKANVRYTEYPGVGHNSWDKAYAEPELIPWLLSQKLSH